MREVEAYRRFKCVVPPFLPAHRADAECTNRHPNIIRILDSAVVQDPDGEGKIVYLFLPLYKVRQSSHASPSPLTLSLFIPSSAATSRTL